MKKEYVKPEAELVSLLALEKITMDDDLVDASLGTNDNVFG